MGHGRDLDASGTRWALVRQLLELHHGHHRYLFVADGEPKLDPNATGIVRNERNERVSLIAVS